jgi:hypothetical protein
VWHQIQEVHGGQVNDSRFGTRMRGEGAIAESIANLFKISRNKFFPSENDFEFDLSLYNPRAGDAQMSLF